MSDRPLLIIGQHGLGDTINFRPYVRAACERGEVFLTTPWPQLFKDLPVKCVRPGSVLRTQRKNEDSVNHGWHERPRIVSAVIRQGYNTAYGNLHEQYEAILPLLPSQTWTYDIPKFDKPPQAPDCPYAVVRPATVREEWRADSRNPDPWYVARTSTDLRARGIAVVTIAALEKGKEWLAGDPPSADVELLHGELSTDQMLGLIQHATICAGAPGFLPHAAMASRVPSLTIYGGRGGYHHPSKDLPTRKVDVAFENLVPEPQCQCYEQTHDCRKTIDGFEEKLKAALDKLLAPQN